MIGGLSFVAGFVLAAAVAAPIIRYYARVAVDNLVGRTVIDPLLATSQLLQVTARKHGKLLPRVVANATNQSFIAATQFDGLRASDQRIVLRQFAALNRSPILRADRSPSGNAARLARVMVLCTHHHAQTNWVHFNKDSGATAGVPAWVLDSNAKPVRPEKWNYGMLRFTDPQQLQALAKHWDTLHTWVIQHQTCAEENNL